ncbi:PREDICTED: type-1 protein phosphatase inhibitor 4-like [Galeopterus variegatus]|uniref:Type-1 protein phosphatase inhibitor 4-like n=1 Tax=Galeopterus variegatus TaxID=482537 RepID=A0ABM0R9Z6_GALVR|nr:PREDICTED: type-1 protein phosphatase inhibitor 4-like [Galeopterus variegatus]
MAASAASQRRIKGILKKGSLTSSGTARSQESAGGIQAMRGRKSQKWDESNIRATYRQEYGDSDLLQLNESGVQDDGEDKGSEADSKEPMTVDKLAKKFATTSTSDQEDSGVQACKILLDRQERRRQFERKRKLHYSQGPDIKIAKQLVLEELQDEEAGESEEGLCAMAAGKNPTEAPAGDEL